MHQTDALIRHLLATGTMNEDTTAELNRMLAEFEAGTLHPDDAAYVAALHARVTDAPPPEPADDPPGPTGPARLDGLTIEDWRDRALRAEAELAEIRDSMASSNA